MSDYNLTWTQPEVYIKRADHPFEMVTFEWRGFARLFDCDLVNECGRSRYLSPLFYYLSSVFRVWLLQYVPPHPSLSLTWPLSLASIVLVYRTIVDWTRDRTAARLGVGLYVLSGGFLSTVLMLFNPAKPLSAFFVSLCLFLAARLSRSGDRRAFSANAVLLYLSMFLAFCSDELAWSAYGAVLILFPELYRRRNIGLAAGLLAIFPLFLIFVTWGAPIATEYLWGYRPAGFWEYIFAPNDFQGTTPYLERLDVPMALKTAYLLVRNQFAWPWSGATAAALSLLPVSIAVVVAGMRAAPGPRTRLLRAALICSLFALYEGFALLHIGQPYADDWIYYYAAVFPIFAVLVAGAAVNCCRGRPLARALCVLACIFLGGVSFGNAMEANGAWMNWHEDIYARDILGGDYPFGHYGALILRTPLTEAKVARYWRAARAGDNLRGLHASFAPKDLWLFEEMDVWFCSKRACCVLPRRFESPFEKGMLPRGLRTGG